MRKFSRLLFWCGCLMLSGALVKANLNAPEPDCFSLNTDQLTIKPSSCGGKDGAVSGITLDATGKFSYVWTNEQGAVVGKEIDLNNVPGGKYKLQVSGPESCPKQSVSVVIDEKNAIVTDVSNIKSTPAGCDDKGSILGIKITGADRIEWKSFINGAVVSTTEDLINVPSGIYKLTAYNNSGCVKDIGSYLVSNQMIMPIVDNIDIHDPTCGQSKGDVTINLSVSPNQEVLEWIIRDAAGTPYLSGMIRFSPLSNTILPLQLAPGAYTMFVKGSTGCEVTLTSFTIDKNVLKLLSDSIGVINDQCNQHKGRILGIAVKGLTVPPPRASYTWTDAKGNPVGGRDPILLDVGAGKYTLHIIDPGGCELDATFTIKNESPALIPPQINGADICLPGEVSLAVEHADAAGFYRLYDTSAEDAVLVAENKNGAFTIPVEKTTKFQASYVQGTCESERTNITVNVAAPGIHIPNTFTPNGDGINDYWHIDSLELYPETEVNVYNRYGQTVYHSVNYIQPFDGREGGKELPEGVYYYNIDIRRINCKGKIKGSLTLLR